MDVDKTYEELKREAEEYLAGWKRAKADLVNFQKQVERERTEWFMYASAGCVKEMLPALDSLEAAISRSVISTEAKRSGEIPGSLDGVYPDRSIGARDDINGISKIRDQMLEALKSMGVEAISVTKEPPNPELHEVVGVERVEEVASGLMARELQRGYTLHGKVLRPAKVIVAE